MGTSDFLGVLSALKQDHPHAYGDKVYLIAHCLGGDGSSPRVWGQDIALTVVV